MKTKILLFALPIILIGINSCTENFSSKTEYSLSITIKPEEGGIVNPSVGEYEAGTEVTIEAIPSAGYRFEGWSGEWSGTENPLTITMNSDKVLNANFQVLIYTAENGVTIKCSEAAEIGDTANINGKLYRVVSEQELRGMVRSGEDLSSAVTTKVTDMHGLFFEMFEINPDIGSWDVSRVREMAGMFDGATSFNQDLSNWDTSSAYNCNGFAIGADSWTLPKPNFINCDCGCK